MQMNLKSAIFGLAAAKYNQIDNTYYISHMLRADFEKQNPLFHFSEELFKRTVSKICFDDDGSPLLVLKNNQKI